MKDKKKKRREMYIYIYICMEIYEVLYEYTRDKNGTYMY